MADGLDIQRWLAQIGTTQVLQLVHLAMALSVLELVSRPLYGWRRGETANGWGQVLHVGAGLWLMMALREALTANRPMWLLLWLSAAGATHVADIVWRRLHPSPAPAPAKSAHHIKPS